MPLIATHILEARRAAALAAAQLPTKDVAEEPPPVQPRTRIRRPNDQAVHPPTTLPAGMPDDANAAKPDEKPRQGVYSVGYKRPPEHTRFKKGCAPGPGRPRNSQSHDTMFKRQLELKHTVRVNGREKKLSHREIVYAKTVMDAVEGKDREARKFVLAESARLFGTSGDPATSMPAPLEPTESDILSLQEYEADLREQVRAELKAELKAELMAELAIAKRDPA